MLILGRSGSGKSTLALNLVGIYPDYFGGRNQGRMLLSVPEQGLVNRRDLAAAERFKRVNMLFQNPEDQIVTLTVEEEVGFAMENYLFEPAEIHRRIDQALDLVGLSGFRERSMLQLSGGEKQRVALAAMLALQPSVLILDEPTSNLDPAGTADVLATIDRVRAHLGLTVLVIEHEVDAVFDRVDAVLLVEERHVAGPFTPRAFIEERGLYVRDEMGLWIPQAAEVGLELRARGIDLGTVPLNGDELLAAVATRRSALPLPAGGPGAAAGAVAGDAVIEVRDVHFSYDAQPVLRGVTCNARRHELLAIVGQNGSGKSTLASLFNGIEQPTSGAVLVDGMPTTEYAFAHLARRVAHIFQVPEKQFVRNTVYDEIAHGLRALGLSETEVDQRTVALLQTVRLLDRRDASPLRPQSWAKAPAVRRGHGRGSAAGRGAGRTDFRPGLSSGQESHAASQTACRRRRCGHLHYSRHAAGRRIRRPLRRAVRRQGHFRRNARGVVWRAGRVATCPAHAAIGP